MELQNTKCISPLSGLRVMVVEDTVILAMDLADQLTGWGCEVLGPFAKVAAAIERSGEPIDGALLDVNLGNEESFPIASALMLRGIPFIFMSGYDQDTEFPAEFDGAPRLTKPLDFNTLVETMQSCFAETGK